MTSTASPLGSRSSFDSSIATSFIGRYLKLEGQAGIVLIQSLYG